MRDQCFTCCFISRASLQKFIYYFVFCRGSHKKEERSTEGREGAEPHTGKEKLGLFGHPALCKSKFSDINSSLLS